MTTAALIQARMGSQRLPGKVLRTVAGRPLLALMIQRVRRAQRIERIVVATSTAAADAQICDLCESLGIDVVRGSEHDVLDRMMLAARSCGASEIVRLTADCPFIDPSIIDSIVDLRRSTGADYASNVLQPSFPDGLDVEVITASALELAAAEACLQSEREHVTPFIRNHPERFRLVNFSAPADFAHLRWTIDEPADFLLAQAIVAEFPGAEDRVGWLDIVAAQTRNPQLLQINSGFVRNEGYLRSIANDHLGGNRA